MTVLSTSSVSFVAITALFVVTVRMLVSIRRAKGQRGESWELGNRDKYRSPTRRPAGEVSTAIH